MQNGNGQHAFWHPFGDREALRALRAGLGARERTPVAIAVRRSDATSTQAAADLYETDEAVVVVMDVPGHDPSGMELHFEKGVLTIRSTFEQRSEDGREYHLAERKGGLIERAFQMPASIDPERIDAAFHAGILTVTLPKREESKPRKIAVKISS